MLTVEGQAWMATGWPALIIAEVAFFVNLSLMEKHERALVGFYSKVEWWARDEFHKTYSVNLPVKWISGEGGVRWVTFELWVQECVFFSPKLKRLMIVKSCISSKLYHSCNMYESGWHLVRRTACGGWSRRDRAVATRCVMMAQRTLRPGLMCCVKNDQEKMYHYLWMVNPDAICLY